MTVRGALEVIAVTDEIRVFGVNGVKIYSGKFWNCPDAVRNLEMIDKEPVVKDHVRSITTITVKEVF